MLSITDEQGFKVNQVIGPSNYHPPVLLDTDGKVHKQFSTSRGFRRRMFLIGMER